MLKSSYLSFISITLFALVIWTINNIFLYDLFKSNISQINTLKEEVYFKKSFSQQRSAANLSNSIDSFVPDKLDKINLTDSIARFATESAVTISEVNIRENQPRDTVNNSFEELTSSNKSSASTGFETKGNTFKLAQLNVQVSGQKLGIDSFIDKLVNNPQYIDIINVNLNKSQSGNEFTGTIIATIYYKGL